MSNTQFFWMALVPQFCVMASVVLAVAWMELLAPRLRRARK